MSDSVVSEKHRALLEAQLRSFEKLELLHAVRTAERPMSRDQLVAVTRLGHDLVVDVLTDLERAHLIELDQGRKLVTLGRAAREPDCESLMALYQADRFAVLSVLSSIAVGRIRNMAAYAFADAFVLRKKKGDEDG